MGGDVDRIEVHDYLHQRWVLNQWKITVLYNFFNNFCFKVLTIDMDDEQEAHDIFDDVHVGECECFLEKDRQKLLGIIEQGKNLKF